MTWNYRVMRHGNGWLAIHEVHYFDDGKGMNCTVRPVDVSGESIEELRGDLERMMRALDEPILAMPQFEENLDEERS